MRTRSRLAAGIAASVLVIGLSACATQTAEPAATTPAPSPEAPAPTTEDTPAPTAAPIDSEDPSTWVVTDAGMGPVTLGAPLPAAIAVMPEGTRNDAESCAWTAWWNAPDGRYQVYAARESDAGEVGPVTTIESSMLPESTGVVGPSTPEGIGVGSTLEDVQAAYPGADFMDTSDGSAVGGRRFIALGETTFLTFYEGATTVSAITVTEADTPPYEVCG